MKRAIIVLGVFLLSACSTSGAEVPSAGSGITVDVSSILRGFADAGSMVVGSVKTIWTDAQKRANDIAEGAEKMKEGKEQMERGILGE